MADQTTAPPATVRADTDPVWRRLVMDCAAYQRAYPTPAHLAELVTQAIHEGFKEGVVFGLSPREQWKADDANLNRIIASVMDRAAAAAGDNDLAALHALAHAGQRERAARHARTETPAVGNETNGGNCGE